MSERAYIDVQELSDEGYMVEANRRFFHPLGLALERSGGWTEEDVSAACADLGLGASEAQVVVRFLAHVGLTRPHLSGVWDSRDDPEGIIFALDGPPSRVANGGMRIARAAANIDRIWKEREEARVKALGFMVQPPLPPGWELLTPPKPASGLHPGVR